MNKYFKSLFAIVVFPLLMLLTGCNSEGAFSESTVKLERIVIAASSITTQGVSQLTLAAGNKQPFEAVGHYSDGSSRTLTGFNVSDWHTSDLDTGYFNTPGVLVGGDSPGIVQVTATKDGITSNAVSVNVTAAVITAIQVTPATVNIARGQTQQLTAIATYTDNSSSDISSSATWTSDDINTATVTSTGLLTGVDVGTITVTATKDGITSNAVSVNVTAAVITAIQVTPSPVSVGKGYLQQLVAMATYSDNSSSDVSNSVTWTSDNTAIAMVTSMGEVTGVEVGSTTLTAFYDGVTSNVVSIEITTPIEVCGHIFGFPLNTTVGGGINDADVNNASGTCIKIAATDDNTWFTSTPSTALMSALGYTSSNGDGFTDSYANTWNENGTAGPIGSFARFDQLGGDSVGIGGQYDRWCQKLSSRLFAGKDNWQRATYDELTILLAQRGNMFTNYGWPAFDNYWSSTIAAPGLRLLQLRSGANGINYISGLGYASCVSNP
ncbi:Ig-like domain-containing protein [Vibrio crassostreae]|uniref:Ig-like domain-containing protein n=1 Tax=Vibrio crassostreae TaxID=246167 RepID=UPI0010485944|nr:Ig-like domain-containing protein [Vibrio crassostreae]TCT58380.1 Ig-like protein group 2 [Vibrio crassostreae]